MNTKASNVQPATSGADLAKYVLAFLVAAGGIALYYAMPSWPGRIRDGAGTEWLQAIPIRFPSPAAGPLPHLPVTRAGVPQLSEPPTCSGNLIPASRGGQQGALPAAEEDGTRGKV